MGRGSGKLGIVNLDWAVRWIGAKYLEFRSGTAWSFRGRFFSRLGCAGRVKVWVFQVVPGGQLVGMGDGQQFGFSEQSPGERDGRGNLAAL